MDGDDIALFVDGVDIHILSVLLHLVVLEHIVSQNLAAEAGEALNDGQTDLAGAHDAHGHGAQLAAHLALQGKVVVIGVVQCLLELTDAHENGHDGVLSHTVGSVSAVAQAELQLTGIVTVHVVVAHAAGGQHLHAVALELVKDGVAVVGLTQSGDAVTALCHVGSSGVKVSRGGNQLNAVLSAQSLNHGFFIGTNFVSSDLHNNYLLLKVVFIMVFFVLIT